MANSARSTDIADLPADLTATLVSEIEAGGDFVAEPGGENLDPSSDARPTPEGFIDDADLALVQPPAEDAPVDEPPPAGEPPAEETPPPEAAGPDPTALAAIEQREAASRERIAAERREAQAQTEREIQAFREEFSQRYPDELLKAAEEYRDIANLDDRGKAEYYYRKHKAESGEPGYERDNQQLRQQTATERRIAKIEADNAALRQQIAARENQAAGMRFIDSVVGVAKPDTHPHVSRWLEGDPGTARDAIARHAVELQQKYGELPSGDDVLKSLEKRRADTFNKLGYQLPNSQPPLPQTPAPATQTPAAISSDLSTSTPTGPEPDDLESRSELAAREIEHLFKDA